MDMIGVYSHERDCAAEWIDPDDTRLIIVL